MNQPHRNGADSLRPKAVEKETFDAASVSQLVPLSPQPTAAASAPQVTSSEQRPKEAPTPPKEPRGWFGDGRARWCPSPLGDDSNHPSQCHPRRPISRNMALDQH